MSELKRTSINDEHYHYVYLRDDNTAFTSIADDGHTHEVKYVPPVEPITDPDTQEVLNEGQPGRFELEKAKGHTHKILLQSESDSLPRTKFDNEKKFEDNVVEMTKALYKAAKDLEKTSRKNSTEAFEFYEGKQWDDADRRELEAKDRACLTINEIEPKIDVLTGYQRQNRYDITYLPVEGGDAVAADMMSFVAKNILEQNNFDHEESEAFEDQVIGGRGILTAYIDFTRTVRGEIRAESFPWDGVYYGPHRRKDMEDCEYQVKAFWYSLQKLRELYPDHEEEFTPDKMKDFVEKDTAELQIPGKNYDNPDAEADGSMTPKNEYVDEVKKEYLVIELQKKRFRRVPVAINAVDDYIFDGQFIDTKDVKKIKTIPGFDVIYKVACEMEIFKVAKDILLEEDYSDDDTFDTMPVYGKKKGDKWWGKVEPVKDAQRNINKRHSSMVDIVNKMAAYGWFYTGETFPDVNEEQKFKRNSAKPGFTQKIRSFNDRPQQVEGTKFPAELAQLEEMSSMKIREIMNVNQEMMGVGPQSQSGVAIAEKRRQGLIGNEFLFDNLSLARRMLGRRLFRLIQKVYTPERVMNLINDQKNKGGKKVGQQPVEIYTEEKIEEILNDLDASKYDVVVSESAHSPSKRIANFLVWSDMAKQGVPIPPEMLIEMSDLPEKDRIIAKMEEQKQQAMDLEQQKMQTELQKTAMARGGNQ